MNKNDKIYVAGHRGLVGTALIKTLSKQGYQNLITRTHEELDLTDEQAVEDFFKKVKPDYVFLAAAKVGGIQANNTYPAEFIHENLAIQSNVIHHAYLNKVKRLLFLGSSCIYPKNAPQPLKEEYLLTGPLEETNRPYALAKIAGIEMCWSYNRQYGTQFLSVMPTNLFGSGDNYDLNNSHVLPALLRKFHLANLANASDVEKIVENEKKYGRIPEPMRTELFDSATNGTQCSVTIWGTGTPRREFMCSDDMADACLFLMNLPSEKFNSLLGSERHMGTSPVINVGVGRDMSIKELAGIIKSVVGFDGDINFDREQPDGTPQKLLNIDKLKNLGWSIEPNFISRLNEAYIDYLERI